MPLLALLVGASSLLGTPSRAPADLPPAPTGWTRTEPKPGIGLYVPGDLKAGETYSVAIYPVARFEGADTKAWLREAMGRDPISVGRIAAPEVAASNIGTATMTTAGGAVAGGKLAALYIAATGGGKGRVLRIAMSSETIYQRYEKGTRELIATLAAATSAKSDPAATSPTGTSGGSAGTADADGNVIGGPIRPGVYEGPQTWGDKPHRRLRVTLYPNGEYRLEPIDEAGKATDESTNGEYAYDPANGGLKINSIYSLMHDAKDPRDEACVFATVKGTPVIYGSEDRGFSRLKTTLVWRGAPIRPTPKAERATEEAKRAEEARYKFTVAPGKGLRTEAVEAIVHNSQFVFNPMGSTMNNTVTILLKDGTAHEGFRAPLDSWDVAASRKGEPETWGKWKRSGKGYLVAYKGGAYEELPGSVVGPAPASGRLVGRWGAGSGGGGATFGSYSLWGVRFGKDGRFLKDSRGGSGTTSAYTDATGVAIFTGRDSIPEKNSGTYRLEGYMAVLRYDDGRVARIPFFVLDGEMIWFEDYILLKDDGE